MRVLVTADMLHEPNNIAEYLRTHGLLRRDAAWCGIAPGNIEEIAVAADEVLRRPDRLRDLARCAAALFDPGPWKGNEWTDTPRDDSPGERYFFLLPLLQHLEVTMRWYAARGIPESVLRETMTDLQIWIDTCRERTGRPGLREAGWLREHFNGRIFRLGRLQFQPAKCGLPCLALSRRRDGKVCLVARGGSAVVPSGIYADSEGAAGSPIALVCEEVEGEIRLAHRIQPEGRISPKPTGFEAGVWETRLAPGDPVLALHIPAGAPLAFEACRDSFRRAAAFFPRYFGDAPVPRGVTCGSWLFYPGLCDLLPPDANIVRFQLAFHRFPLPGATSAQTCERAFHPHGRAITREQLKGTLQHRLFDHIQSGHVPISGGGLVLPPLDNWGMQGASF